VNIAFQTFKVLTLLLYALTFFYYFIFYLKGSRRSNLLTTPLLLVTCFVHLIYLFVISMTHGHAPVTNLGEAMTLMVFCITVTYYFIELSSKEKSLGAFVLAMVLLLQAISSFFIDEIRPVSPILQEGGFALHAIANILSYSGFFLGFTFSGLYLLMLRQIKKKKTGLLYSRMPSLGILDTMSAHSIAMGFGLYSLGLIAGAIWANKVWGVYFKPEPKFILALVTWAVYGGYLAFRRLPGQSRKSSAIWAVASFSLLILSFFFASLVSPSHSF
jgi:ABC-type transport system involved in cytochrome c biogenesis permease subunit